MLFLINLTIKCQTNLRNYLKNHLSEISLRNSLQDMLVNIIIKIKSEAEFSLFAWIIHIKINTSRFYSYAAYGNLLFLGKPLLQFCLNPLFLKIFLYHSHFQLFWKGWSRLWKGRVGEGGLNYGSHADTCVQRDDIKNFF